MKTGHCIICHRDGVDLSDEHVIPDAIGGYYHIYITYVRNAILILGTM